MMQRFARPALPLKAPLRPRLIPLVLATVLVSGCHWIFPYRELPADGGSKDQGILKLDKAVKDAKQKKDGKLKKDTKQLKDSKVPKDTSGPQDSKPAKDGGSCPPTGMLTIKNAAGGWILAVHANAKSFPAVIIGARKKEEAQTLDTLNEASGFIYSLPTNHTEVSKVRAEMAARLKAYANSAGASLHTITAGVPGTSHDGSPNVIGARYLLSLPTSHTPVDLRTPLLAALLNRKPGNVTSLYQAVYSRAKSQTFVVALSPVLWASDGRYVVTGMVADSARVQNRNNSTSVILDDVTNGTAVAKHTASTASACVSKTLSGHQPMTDIIWVMDESGSMNGKNLDVANKVTDISSLASRYRLDYRHGVTGMKGPFYVVPPDWSVVGKLCSKASTVSTDSGGADRFLLPSEKSTFQACLKNPPHYMGGQEYGLTNAFHVVTKHIPRKAASANDKTRVRYGAILALIVVTDEGPEELKVSGKWNGKAGFLAYGDFGAGTCALSPTKTTALKTFIQDWTTLYGGKHGTHKGDARAIFNLIGGVCFESCTKSFDVPWGYQEIAAATGGHVGSICPQDLWPSLEQILESLAGAASEISLGKAPISVSLAVTQDSKALQRSRSLGFDYRAVSNRLVLVGKNYTKGSKLRIAYRHWK